MYTYGPAPTYTPSQIRLKGMNRALNKKHKSKKHTILEQLQIVKSPILRCINSIHKLTHIKRRNIIRTIKPSENFY